MWLKFLVRFVTFVSVYKKQKHHATLLFQVDKYVILSQRPFESSQIFCYILEANKLKIISHTSNKWKCKLTILLSVKNRNTENVGTCDFLNNFQKA